MFEKLGVGIVGCGNIAGPYAENLAIYPQIELLGMTDIDFEYTDVLPYVEAANAD